MLGYKERGICVINTTRGPLRLLYYLKEKKTDPEFSSNYSRTPSKVSLVQSFFRTKFFTGKTRSQYDGGHLGIV